MMVRLKYHGRGRLHGEVMPPRHIRRHRSTRGSAGVHTHRGSGIRYYTCILVVGGNTLCMSGDEYYS